MMRVLIVDDHPLVRRGFRELMDAETNVDACSEAADANDALLEIEHLRPDVVVVDLTLKSGISGLELIKKIKAEHSDTRVLVFTMHDEQIYGERCLRAGAMGYVNKDQDPQNLLAAIRSVAQGKVFVSPELTARFLMRAVGADDDLQHSPVERLSDRELEVFELIGDGMTTREIAAQLDLSTKTIETYREHIKDKLGLRNSAELSRSAVQWAMGNATPPDSESRAS